MENIIARRYAKAIARTDDGVHFTPSGAREMSKLLLEHIKLKEENASK